MSLGVAVLPVFGQGTITPAEPNDSIPTATNAGFAAGSSGVKVAYGHNGDGPYGEQGGNGTGDVDFYRITVAAGQTIMVNMANAGIDPDFDPYAAIYNASGVVVAENDDKGDTSRGYDRTPRIVFTAPTAGDYYVCVSSWVDGTDNLPSDPMTAGTGPGLPSGKAGPYQLILAVDAEAPVPQFVGGSTGYPVSAFLPAKVIGTPRFEGVLTISNKSAGMTAASNLVITSSTITGPDADRFFVRGLSLPATIRPGEELNVNIAFNSAGLTDGGAQASMVFTSNDPLALPFIFDTAANPVVDGGVFTVRQINAPSGTAVNNWGIADGLLDGSIAGGTEYTGTSQSINFGTGSNGNFRGDTPYLNGGTDPNNIVLQIKGTIRINEAGTYTFLGRSDDGQRLAIDGQVLGEFTDYDVDHYYTVELTAGNHELEFTHYEGGGGNHAELLLSRLPGEFSAYNVTIWDLIEAAGADADGDGLPDAWETANGLNPNSATGDDGAEGNPDSDGLVNRNEYFFGTNPQVADTDGDGLLDGVETDTGFWVSVSNTGTSPTIADTDRDGILDGQENLDAASGTDPNKLDTDGDGYADGTELALDANPKSAASTPGLVFSSAVLTEDFDAAGLHSVYAFTKSNATPVFEPGVLESDIAANGNSAWLTDQENSNVNSIAWDLVQFPSTAGVQLSVDVRITPVEGDTNPADGFGIGLFRTANYGTAGGQNPGLAPPNWENPVAAPGFTNALAYGMTVYGTDYIRMAGPAAPTAALYGAPAPFGLASGLFNRVIITVLPNLNNSSMVKLEIIEDVNGVATRRVLSDNFLVPGFSITNETFRLIAGGRTGGANARIELDNVKVSVPPATAPTLAFSNTATGLLATLYDGTASAVNPATMQVTLNGAPLEVTTAKQGSVTTVSYTAPVNGFLPGGVNTVVFSYSDAAGTPLAETRSFVSPYVVLPPGLAQPLSSGATSGFAVRTVQGDPMVAGSTIPNRLDYAEGLLAGFEGSPFNGGNVADLSAAQGGVFTVGVINFEQEALAAGYFSGETLVPGIPGTTGSLDNYVFEAKTWIEFSEPGIYQFGVVADDGIRVSYTHAPVPGMTIVTPAASARTLAVVPSINGTAAGGISGPYPNPPIVGKVVLCEPAIAADANQNSIITNGAALAGNVALMERGTSGFSYKIKAAQAAGAIAAIIINQTAADGLPIQMGGDGPDITGVTIPGVMISRADGDALKALIASPTGLEVKFGPDESTTLAATDINTTTVFNVAVPAAGLYPIRLLNFEGGGGANCEWYSVDADGVRHLLNDPADPAALKAYATVTAGPVPTISISRSGANVTITYTGTLEVSTDLIDWQPVTGAASPYTTPTAAPAARYFRAR